MPSKPRPSSKQVPAAARKRVLTEPLGRNTAAAIALAAFHVRHAARGDALMAVLPADHFIAQPEKYRKIVSAALELAREPGRMVVLGIPPTRPDTGFGYVERMGDALGSSGFPAFAVRRFTEKPALDLAKEYVASGTLSMERRHVFLARLDISRQSEKLSSENARSSRIAGRNHRQANLRTPICAQSIRNLRIFPSTTPSSKTPRARKAHRAFS